MKGGSFRVSIMDLGVAVRGVAGCPRIGGRRVFARGYAVLLGRHTPCVARLFCVAKYAAQIAPQGACPLSQKDHTQSSFGALFQTTPGG